MFTIRVKHMISGPHSGGWRLGVSCISRTCVSSNCEHLIFGFFSRVPIPWTVETRNTFGDMTLGDRTYWSLTHSPPAVRQIVTSLAHFIWLVAYTPVPVRKDWHRRGVRPPFQITQNPPWVCAVKSVSTRYISLIRLYLIF